jgi:hypothetical protein
MLSTTQLSVNLVHGKTFRSKILTDPRFYVIVFWVTTVLEYFKKVSKALWSSAVFGRALARSCHTNLPERLVSDQNLFKQKFVLPAVTKIVLV